MKQRAFENINSKEKKEALCKRSALDKAANNIKYASIIYSIIYIIVLYYIIIYYYAIYSIVYNSIEIGRQS